MVPREPDLLYLQTAHVTVQTSLQVKPSLSMFVDMRPNIRNYIKSMCCRPQTGMMVRQILRESALTQGVRRRGESV